MLEQLLNHIGRYNLFQPGDRVLLAVSGGLDSMVMVDLFRKGGYSIGVAHVNFQLRGDESEEDEAFVKQFCNSAGVPFHTRRFDTFHYGKERGLSIQLAARELRYTFFSEVAEAHQYSWIATAHHLNDSLETFLLNTIRGTGIDGLTGIAVKKGNVIRPLLFATREQLEHHAHTEGIPWREDSSNQKQEYRRNLIRHKVIPLLKQINPNLEEGFNNTIERIGGAKILSKTGLQQLADRAVRPEDNRMIIDIAVLKENPYAGVLLWELLKGHGFHYGICREIVKEHAVGKMFFSDSNQLLIERGVYIVTSRPPLQDFEIKVEADEPFVEANHRKLEFSRLDKHAFVLEKNPGIAQLDADKVRFPLTWRPWRNGDAFYPLGMQQRKKVSDFLIDMKSTRVDKQQVTVLESKGEIIWLVGLRIDNRFKVDSQTKNILKITQITNY